MRSFLCLPLAAVFAAVCLASAIDSPECRSHFPNQTQASLSDCETKCGKKPTYYNFSDIQSRVGTWIVPLFILIGSLQFAPLGLVHIIFVILHLLADPIGTLESLLSKIEAEQSYVVLSQAKRGLPAEIRHAVAILLSAFDEWEEYFGGVQTCRCRVKGARENSPIEAKLDALTGLLDRDGPKTDSRRKRLNACLEAAKKLSESRVNGASKTFLGTLNYILASILAFMHLNLEVGRFNNRTGHSIAFGMLYTWLIPPVCLSAMVGGFATKYSSRRVLEELQSELDRVSQVEEPVFRFSAGGKSTKMVYRSLEWSGANYSFQPHRCTQSRRRKVFMGVALIPVIGATSSAVYISYTNPTRGIGCRSVMQICYLAAWITSAFVTYGIRKLSKDKHMQWLLTRIKNLFVFVPQSITFCLGFVGWFNSCYCWSSKFSLHSRAHVEFYPDQEIKSLAKRQWPIAAGSVLALQLSFVTITYAVFRKGIRLYRMSNEEREFQFTQEHVESLPSGHLLPSLDFGPPSIDVELVPLDRGGRRASSQDDGDKGEDSGAASLLHADRNM